MEQKDNIAIRIEGLSKVYVKKNSRGKLEEFYALRKINLEIKKGERLAIIGENGSGKSTLLKILSGITKPNSGQVTINGVVGSVLDVGAGFHPELSGKENVYLRGALLGMSKSEINLAFDEIVEFSGIGDFIYTAVKKYSSGMFLRLAFSIIIHLKIDILLLDEVMAVGDVAFQVKVLKKNEELIKKGITIIYVSHDTVSRLAALNLSRIILLKEGEVAKIGGLEVLRKYQNKHQNLNIDKFNDSFYLLKNIVFRDISVSLLKFGIEDFLLTPKGLCNQKGFSFFFEIQTNNNDIIDVGIRLFDQYQTPVLLMTTMQNVKYSIKQKGLHRLILKLPQKLLNNAIYTGSLLIIKNKTEELLIKKSFIKFQMSNFYDPCIVKDDDFYTEGVVSPLIEVVLKSTKIID